MQTVQACDEAGIRTHLLRSNAATFEKKLDFILQKRDFSSCDFKFQYRYDVDIYFSVKMTFVNEVHFYERGPDICVETYEVGSAHREGPNAGKFSKEENPRGAPTCIAKMRTKTPARSTLLDWLAK